ncbi:MAG: GGDEF domain-containing protein [Peptostreptococcales bacterium]
MNNERDAFELIESVGNLGYWVYNHEENPGMIYGSINHNKMFDFDCLDEGLIPIRKWRRKIKACNPRMFDDLKYKMHDIYSGKTDHFEITFPIIIENKKKWIKSNGFCRCRNRRGKAIEIVGTAVDVTDLMNLKDRLEYLAYWDETTGLPNREKLFSDYETNKIIGNNMVYMDIDGFKQLNDRFGHQFGDQCLKAYGKRLRNFMKQSTGVQFYRLYGDEFIGFCDIPEDITTEEYCEAAKKNLQAPHVIDGIEIELNASMGIIEKFDNKLTIQELLHKADTAMYLSKKSFNKTYIYKKQDSSFSEINIQDIIDSDVMSNLDCNNIIPYFQPIINRKTGKIEVIEVLARIKIKNEIIKAKDFIDIAIQRQKAEIIDKVILEKGVKLLFELQNKQIINEDVAMSFNISEQTFCTDDFIEYLTRLMKDYSINCKNIILEFVEKSSMALLQNFDLIQKIKKLGIKISLDDFSVGNSSINAMRCDLYDFIKFDKKLLWRATENKNIEEVYDFFINILTKNKLDIIAEGVETETHKEFLEQKNIKYVQGFIYFEPVPENNLITILSREQHNY